MSFKKKISAIVIFIILAVVVAGGIVFSILAPIITGYAAKNLASGIFVAGRSQESLEKEDLNFSFIKYTVNKVDYEKKEVTSHFLCWSSKAIYVEGFGCTLLRGFSADEIRSRKYPVLPAVKENTDTIAWPSGDKIADTIPSGIDKAALDAAIDEAFADTLPFKGTFAVTVAYKNQLVAERYRNDFSKDTRFLSWSMAKSFISALVGIRVGQGMMNVEAPAPVKEWQNDRRKNITLGNLLKMNTGLEWNEDYGSNSDVNIMLFKKPDYGTYAASKRAEFAPDSVFYYSSGSTNITSRLIRETFDNYADYILFPYKDLFRKIGMNSALFEFDASGTFAGSSYLYATMRDYTRFGLLYMNGGKWGNEQILPKGWTEYTWKPGAGSNGNYGAYFRVNYNKEYKNVPEDALSARGHDGQYIFIIPSKNLVIVRTGFSQHKSFDPEKFVEKIVACVK